MSNRIWTAAITSARVEIRILFLTGKELLIL
jgi:hypothetical protein